MRSSTWTRACGPVLVLATCLAYASSFAGLFIGDDRKLLVEDPHIADFTPLLDKLLLFGGNGQCTAGRPVVAASFMLNLVLDGAGPRSPWPYHLVNVAAHAACALLLFGVLRRTLVTLGRFSRHATGLSFACSLLWALHPVHTSAVTVVCQRAEVFMGLFFMLALYAAVRAATAERKTGWRCLSVAAAVLCAGSKEVAAMLPLLVLLHEWTFSAQTFRKLLQRSAGFYAALFGCTWLAVGALVALGARTKSVGLSMGGVNPLNYLLTQGNVLPEYLRLVLLPNPLLFDYGFPIVPVDGPGDLLAQAGSYAPGLACVLALLLAGALALTRRHPLGFAAAWFFLILAPSSSLVPVVTEIMVLHRLYLPALAVLVPLVLAVYAAGQKLHAAEVLSAPALRLLAASALGALALAAALATSAQNQLFHSDEVAWSYTVAHQPDNPRALLNLGRVLQAKGKLGAAIALYERAVAAARATERPKHVFLALCLESAALAQRKAGNLARAATHLHELASLDRERTNNTLLLASVLLEAGRQREAASVLSQASARAPRDPQLRGALIAALLVSGELDAARAQARTQLKGGDPAQLDRELALAAQRLRRPDIAAALAQGANGAAPAPATERPSAP